MDCNYELCEVHQQRNLNIDWKGVAQKEKALKIGAICILIVWSINVLSYESASQLRQQGLCRDKQRAQ